jgi:hypothetical protein
LMFDEARFIRKIATNRVAEADTGPRVGVASVSRAALWCGSRQCLNFFLFSILVLVKRTVLVYVAPPGVGRRTEQRTPTDTAIGPLGPRCGVQVPAWS